jgi:NAD(P)-dependent dehydrogenase (short-subunit alcohol dehydrogenase family)
VSHSDATSLPDVDALAERVNAKFGKLDVLFVNAGLGRFAPFEAVTEEGYDEMLDLNAKGRISSSRNWRRLCLTVVQ